MARGVGITNLVATPAEFLQGRRNLRIHGTQYLVDLRRQGQIDFSCSQNPRSAVGSGPYLLAFDDLTDFFGFAKVCP